MNLLLTRIENGDDYTIGLLSIDGRFFCNTLEDADRGLTSDMSLEDIQSKKVYSKTAIPTGTYTIDMSTISNRFKDKEWAKPYGGKLPRLVDVPGYEGVLIHVGNTVDDTSGCILVGERSGDRLTNSVSIFKSLMSILTKSKETITIKIQ